MTLSPRVGGLASKPVDVSPSPASQRYTSPDCLTTKMTYEFFNELIDIFTFAQTSYAVTNVPNDPNALKKLLDSVRTGGYNFTTGTISASGNISVSHTTNPFQEYHVTGGNSGYNKPRITVTDDAFAIQTRNSAGASVSTDYLIVRGVSGATSHSLRLGNVEKLRLDSTGLEVNGILSVLGDMIVFGTNSDQLDRIEFDDALNKYSFVESDTVSGTIVEAGVLQAVDNEVIFGASTSNSIYFASNRYNFRANGTVDDSEIRCGEVISNGVSTDTINFGQDDLDYYESGLSFTPTFNAAPTATTRSGKAIKIGNKVDVYMQIAGTAAQRAALGSGVSLDIGNIPFISELASDANAFVSVTEIYGTYLYEDRAQSQSGVVSNTSDVIRLWHQVESQRSIKTVGDWASGDFDFRIHASFITG